MNRRTIPFGYKFENGAVVVEDSAADIVKEIFNRYLAGDSMLNISELLNKLHVEYTPGITGWNKARIKRILENKKYLGNEDFPPIIDEDIALRADEMREVRNKQKNVNKEELIYNLTAETICPCCGTAMKRRFDPRTKIHGRWMCQRSDCRKLVAITDEVMLTEITELLEYLSKSDKFFLVKEQLYNYYINPNGIMKGINKKNKFDLKWLSEWKAVMKAEDYCANKGTMVENAVIYKKTIVANKILSKAMKCKYWGNECEDMKMFIKNNRLAMIRNPFLNLRVKVKSMLYR